MPSSPNCSNIYATHHDGSLPRRAWTARAHSSLLAALIIIIIVTTCLWTLGPILWQLGKYVDSSPAPFTVSVITVFWPHYWVRIQRKVFWHDPDPLVAALFLATALNSHHTCYLGCKNVIQRLMRRKHRLQCDGNSCKGKPLRDWNGPKLPHHSASRSHFES